MAKDDIEQVSYTKYEKARIIGARALQLSMGAPFMIKLSPKDIEDLHYNPIEIAKREFDAGVIPIGVRRIVTRGTEPTEEH